MHLRRAPAIVTDPYNVTERWISYQYPSLGARTLFLHKRASPAIPHFPLLEGLVAPLMKAKQSWTYTMSLESARNMARDNALPKRMSINLEACARFLQAAHRVVIMKRRDRQALRRKPDLELEDRLVKRAYKPWREEIHEALGLSCHTKLTIIRGEEPAVRYIQGVPGERWGGGRPLLCTLTLPLGWTLPWGSKRITTKKITGRGYKGQTGQLIVECIEEPDLFFAESFAAIPELALATIRTIHRGNGELTISPPLLAVFLDTVVALVPKGTNPAIVAQRLVKQRTRDVRNRLIGFQDAA